MHLIGRAGTYTPPEGGESNHWIVHMNSDALSLGTYSIPAGGTDDQEPHTEDEVYVVQAGRATLVTTSGTVPVEPGSVVFVPAGETRTVAELGDGWKAQHSHRARAARALMRALESPPARRAGPAKPTS